MVPVPSRVIDLVIVTAPKPPGSSASISPHAAVFEIAPAQVLQGAVRLHGFTSSPTPDTHVREACAWSSDATAKMNVAIAKVFKVNRNLLICSLLLVEGLGDGPVELGFVPFTVAPIFPAVKKEYVVIKDIGKLLTNPCEI
jgi:hypothetical protein